MCRSASPGAARAAASASSSQHPPPAMAEEFDVDQGLLIAAVEAPSLFSDEEVLALLH